MTANSLTSIVPTWTGIAQSNPAQIIFAPLPTNRPVAEASSLPTSSVMQEPTRNEPTDRQRLSGLLVTAGYAHRDLDRETDEAFSHTVSDGLDEGLA